MKSIYKITNKINHKIYIGISNNPSRRWSEEINGWGDNKEMVIHKALTKYGCENFIFEILETHSDDNEAKRREKELIAEYRCLVPYGYNVDEGGGEPPHYKGEQNPASKITEELAITIKKELQNYNIPLQTILTKNKVTRNIVRHINEGNSWRDETLSYPLRPNEKEINQWKIDLVKNLLKNTDLSQTEIGKQVGWNRSAVTMINIGQNHYDANETYPLRAPKFNKPQSIAQIDKKTGEVINIFPNASAAAIACGKKRSSNSNILNCCKHKPNYNTAFGYIWKYANEL